MGGTTSSRTGSTPSPQNSAAAKPAQYVNPIEANGSGEVVADNAFAKIFFGNPAMRNVRIQGTDISLGDIGKRHGLIRDKYSDIEKSSVGAAYDTMNNPAGYGTRAAQRKEALGFKPSKGGGK